MSCVPLMLPQPYDICWQMLWTLYSSVVKMLLMMWVFPWGKYQSKMHKDLCKKNDMDKKMEKEGNSGKELVEMHFFSFKS